MSLASSLAQASRSSKLVLLSYGDGARTDANFFTTDGLAITQWWTLAEMDLGILCPCLVTFRPLIRNGYLVFAAQLSPRTRERIERISHVSSEPKPDKMSDLPHSGSSTNIHGSSRSHSHESKPSDVESGPPPVPKVYADILPRDKSGMAVNQDAAVANLDPRVRTNDGQTKKMGTSSQAIASDSQDGTPGEGIGVSRDWRLESEHGSS